MYTIEIRTVIGCTSIITVTKRYSFDSEYSERHGEYSRVEFSPSRNLIQS